MRLVPTTLVLFVGVGAGERVLEPGRHELVLELGVHGRARLPRGRRSGTCATPCRRRARSATCCACCCRSRSVSRCSSGILLDMPFRFLGIQGNIAQLGPIQGIFGTRNLLGFVAVIALITFLIEYRTQSVRLGRLGRSRSCSPGASRRSATPPPSSCSPSAVGLAVGALALVRHARPKRRSALQLHARRHSSSSG